MNQTLERLKKYESEAPSKWREEAEYRILNKRWLRYSQGIALSVLDKMVELGLTQKALAERMGCSQQYVSRIVKGRENLSLETIAKLEVALEVDIIGEVLIPMTGYCKSKSASHLKYLSEGEQVPYGDEKQHSV